MLTNIQVRLLKKISPGAPTCCSGGVYEGRSKLAILMGQDFFAKIAGKTVIDFGCGEGSDAIEMARRGAKRVVGIDIREDVLETARQKAIKAGVENTCCFATSTAELADVVVSVDAFEHFADPAGILDVMSNVLRPEGEVLASFGPTWYHPLGGHLFSVFPWAHLIFSEKALIDWRSEFKTDGATRFSEVAGGLNQMTIAKFEKLAARSPFRLAALACTDKENSAFSLPVHARIHNVDRTMSSGEMLRNHAFPYRSQGAGDKSSFRRSSQARARAMADRSRTASISGAATRRRMSASAANTT